MLFDMRVQKVSLEECKMNLCEPCISEVQSALDDYIINKVPETECDYYELDPEDHPLKNCRDCGEALPTHRWKLCTNCRRIKAEQAIVDSH